MVREISPTEFHESGGLGDWRIVGDGVGGFFRADSFAAGAAFAAAVGALDGLGPRSEVRADSPGDLIDPRWRGVTLWFQQMDAPREQRNRILRRVGAAGGCRGPGRGGAGCGRSVGQ